MNRAEIRTLMEAATGRTDKTTTFDSAINIALRKVSSEHLWNDLLTEDSKTLTTGTNTIVLATDTRRLSEVRVIDGLNSYRLIVFPKTKFSMMYPNPTALSNQKPRVAYLQGTTLHMAPPPDSTYTIKYSYYKLHADFTDNVTETDIPQADEAVVSYAIYWIFKSIEQYDSAVRWFADYEDQLKDAKRVDLSSAITVIATPRPSRTSINPDFWVDPFVGHYSHGYGHGYGRYY